MRVIATINASTTMPMHVPLPTPSPMPAKTNPATIANARDLRNPLRLLPSLQDQDSGTHPRAGIQHLDPGMLSPSTQGHVVTGGKAGILLGRQVGPSTCVGREARQGKVGSFGIGDGVVVSLAWYGMA